MPAPPPVAGPAGLARLYAAIGATLRPTFAADPGVVVLDDVQQMEQGSLDVVGYLVRRLRELSVLLVVCWSGENSERLRGLASALASAADAGGPERWP